MADENRGGPPSRGGKTGEGNRGPGGGQDRRGGPGGGPGRGGPGRDGRKGGNFGKGPAKPARAELYESLKELTRGEGFRIDKFVAAEKGTHRPVKTEYRLTREGLKGVHVFQRLVEAQAAATAPLPEPEPEPEPIVEPEAAPVEAGAADGETHAEPEHQAEAASETTPTGDQAEEPLPVPAEHTEETAGST
jgi:hypothetical protein